MKKLRGILNIKKEKTKINVYGPWIKHQDCK